VFVPDLFVVLVVARTFLKSALVPVLYSRVEPPRLPRFGPIRIARSRGEFRVDGRALGMHLAVNHIHRCRCLLAAMMTFAALAAPAGAYMLRDNDSRTAEIVAALPEAKAPAAVVAKAVNVDDVKDLVAAKAAAHGVPGEIARAVVQVESDYDAGMTGSVGEVGLMQIKYETARILGYSGTFWELYAPGTTVAWGMRYPSPA